jgi:pyrroloquinoline-quinone synthase
MVNRFFFSTLRKYESQIPAICKTKIDGLKQWYGMQDPQDYAYFSVHATADIEHSQAEKALLMALVTPREEAAVLEGAKKTLISLDNFLTSFLAA